MLDPADFFLVARSLAKPDPDKPPTDAHLRRAISTAYYGLFHFVMQAVAARFMGPGTEASPGYAILYRSVDHGRVRDVCNSLDRTSLTGAWADQLRRVAVSQPLREFARGFGVLQAHRLAADYNPAARFQISQANSIIDGAILATISFGRVLPDERADFLALLLAKTR